jgi:succinate dehydrogenase/fumarate reductase cytochrome b subunit
MNGPVIKIFRILFQAICLFFVAVGLTGAILASFVVSAMVVVWFKEGALQPMDQEIFAKGIKWLPGCGGMACMAWWLRRIVVKKRDDTFRLVESKSGRLEKLVQRVSGFAFVIWLATHLWARDPGSALITVPRVAGWITLGWLGLHAHIDGTPCSCLAPPFVAAKGPGGSWPRDLVPRFRKRFAL